MPLKRALTKREENINFDKYEKFLDTAKEQGIKELQVIIEDQKTIYINKTKNILNSKETIAKKIVNIESLDVKFGKEFRNILREYLDVVCLFSLRQACVELEIKNPKRLSSTINSWIKATSDIITISYLAETDKKNTIPVIDGLEKGMSNQELINKTNLLFDKVKNETPEIIIRGLEGKALFVGRDLAVKLFNIDIKLEAEDFDLASVDAILRKEKVVVAQWSAILDKNTCKLCGSLDGRIISIDSPDYAFYSPGEIHLGCRCMWVYIKNTERPENRIVTWVKPDPILMKKFSTPDTFLAKGSKSLVSSSKGLKWQADVEKVIEDIEKQIGTKLSKRDLRKFVNSDRFKELIVDNGYLKGIKQIRVGNVKNNGLGIYFRKLNAIGLDTTANTQIFAHEIGHHISGQTKFGFINKKGVANKRVEKAYTNALKNYSKKLKGKKGKEIKGLVNEYLLDIKDDKKLLFYSKNYDYEDFINPRGGAVSKYSLSSPSEYISEGFGYYTENPKALFQQDKGLFNLIDSFFKEGKI